MYGLSVGSARAGIVAGAGGAAATGVAAVGVAGKAAAAAAAGGSGRLLSVSVAFGSACLSACTAVNELEAIGILSMVVSPFRIVAAHTKDRGRSISKCWLLGR